MGKLSYNNFMSAVYDSSNYYGTFADFKNEIRRYFTKIFIEEYDFTKYFECSDYTEYCFEFLNNEIGKLQKEINKICNSNFEKDYIFSICAQIEKRYKSTLIERYYELD